ncbi:ABC-type sugar transport system, periplasmic component [Thermobacillus composti KWC4]|uniref:ABC-type sugar transport system, periplasmic component n=1 Tax=Thermobacillus composti (strain DSM 18247 / JCM 13945 / KWC4) TaxID=717605 RepID=L0EC65_THECK|nr:extracellular solute-binding protein [Thermobacillus composti]AGA57229.1 ABC-type sugar transport system, periplasmic component [Thermobacillus composti KWC4]
MKKHTNRWRMSRWLVLLLTLALLLAACSSGAGNREQGGEPVTLKVLHWDEQAFNSDYGMLYYALNPNVEFEVVSTSKLQASEIQSSEEYEKKFEQFIQDEKPDILMLNQDQYEKFAADGRLVSLESYLTRDKLDLEGFIPGLVDLMREKGGGELYGLTPHFYSQAIYYNKDLFDRYNISYPTDKMSWEEVLNLAGRFPTDGSDEDRIYGLSLGYSTELFQLGLAIGTTSGLRVVNPADKRISIDSESWVNAFETALRAIRSDTLYNNENTSFSGSYEDYLLQNPFVSGKVAMAIDDLYLMQRIREAANIIPDKIVKNWDLVTIPVDPANPDYTNDFSFSNIFAIHAESPNRDAAWEFIRYIHSDDYARVKSKAYNTGQLPVRTKYIQDEEGRNMAAFYALKPSNNNLYAGFEDLPQEFFMQYYTIGTEEMKAVVDDQKTVAEALASMQTRLQAALDEAIANQEANGAAGGNEASASVESGMVVMPAESGEAEAGAAGEDSAE